jgi:hypothetical protein
LKEVIKVKAHIEIEVAESEGWLRSWKGNQKADRVARKAAQLDRLSTESRRAEARNERELAAEAALATVREEAVEGIEKPVSDNEDEGKGEEAAEEEEAEAAKPEEFL